MICLLREVSVVVWCGLVWSEGMSWSIAEVSWKMRLLRNRADWKYIYVSVYYAGYQFEYGRRRYIR